MSSPKAAVKTARGKAKTASAPARKAKTTDTTAASAKALQLAAEIEQGILDGREVVSEDARQKLMTALCKVYSFQIQPDGSLAHKQPFYHLHLVEGALDSGADGMTVDTNSAAGTAELFRGAHRHTLASPPDQWGGRTAVAWANALARGQKYDPWVEGVADVADAVDRVLGR